MIKFNFSRRGLFLFIAAFICALSLTNAQSNIDINSPSNRLKFGDNLFCQKDYLRAIDEYREYLAYANNDTVRFKFAYSLAEIGRSKEALDNYKGLFFSSPLSENARMEYYKVSFLNSDYSDFRNLCVMESYLPEEHKPEINRLKLFTHLLDNSYLPDSSDFVNAFTEDDQPEVLSLYLQKKHPEFKSVTKAIVLSAVIPGAGKIYTGQIMDGITALVATGILSYIAYDNFDAGHDFKGALFTTLAALSYAGNIYGTAASAQQYNAGVQFNFENEVKVYLNKKNYFIPPNEFLCR